MASEPFSPVRMRCTAPTSVIQSFPSPIFSVRALATRASAMASTWSSSARTSTLILGTNSTVYSAPRYTSVCPDWRPKPCTSVTVMPLTPAPLSASFTSSSLKGLMTAVISFTVLLSSVRVCRLGVQGQVQAEVLLLVVGSQADGCLDHLGDAEADHERVGEGHGRGDDLVDQEVGAAVGDEEAGVGDDGVDRRVGEEPEHHRAEQTADQVDRDHVEAVVEAELRLQAERQ